MELTPKVKDAADAINSLPSLVNDVMGLLQTPTGWAVLTALFVWFVFNKRLYRVFDIAEIRQRRRLEYLDSYVSKPTLADASSIDVMRDLRDAHYFKIGTGIYAESRLRSCLIQLRAKTSHDISWKQIGKALPFIKAKPDGSVSVRDLSAIEKLGFWYNELVAYLFLLSAAGILALLFLSDVRTVGAVALGAASTLAMFAFAMFLFSQGAPARIAKRIQTQLAADPAPDQPNA